MKVLGIAGNSSAGKDTIAELLVKDHGFQVVAFADELKRLAGRIFGYQADVLFGEPAKRNAVDPRAGDPYYWDDIRRGAQLNRASMLRLFGDAPKRLDPVDIYSKFEDLLKACRAQGEKLTPRFVLQRMGTEWGRSLWGDVWIHEVRSTIELIKDGCWYTRESGPRTNDADYPLPKGIVITDSRFPNEAEAVKSMGGRMLWVDASVRVPKDPKLAHASEPERRDFKIWWGDEERDLIDHDLDNNGTLAELPAKVEHALKAMWHQ